MTPEQIEQLIKEIVNLVKPIKGRDYRDGLDGKNADDGAIIRRVVESIPKPKDGITPVKGKDYLTRDEVEDLIAEATRRARPLKGRDYNDGKPGRDGKDGKTVTEDALDGKEIAKRMNKFRGILDYSVLKNVPPEQKRSPAHGGGQKIQYYDLTSLTDGITKAFTIPANKRVLGVWGTQFPQAYRPLIDWTASGTTLTLTAQVSAPETGQTLYILYVE